MTPAQDATALADRIAAAPTYNGRELRAQLYRIDGDPSVASKDHNVFLVEEKSRETIIAALRATSQTPDAVREVLPRTIGSFSTDDPRGVKVFFAEPLSVEQHVEILKRLSTPSASANLQAETARQELAYSGIYRIAACRCGEFPRLSDDGAKPDDGYRSLWCQTCMEHVTSMMPSEREVIDHWNDQREKEHAALYAHPQPQQTDAVIEDIAKAIEGAEVEYHLRLTSLVDGVSTYALDYGDGTPTFEFDCIDDGYAHIAQKKRLKAAHAVLAALQQSPATDNK